MFGTGSLDAGTLLGVGAVLLAIGAGYRLAAAGRVDAFPVPLLVGLFVAAVGPLDGLHPGPATTRAGAEIAVVVLLFCLGLDFTAADRTAAVRGMPAARLLTVDALNFVPGALCGLLAGFGLTGAVLLGGATWASSWAMASGLLDREGWYGNREAPAALSVLVLEHAAAALFLPVAAALLAPGDTVSQITALLGSAAALAFAAWLVLGPAPLLRSALFAGLAPGPGLGLPLLLVGTVLVLAGVAAAIGVATAGVAYLAGIVLGAPGPNGGGPADVLGTVRRTVADLRELSAAAAGFTLGLLIPASELPGAIAGGAVLAAFTGGTKFLTGWWAVRRLRSSDPVPAPVGRAGGLRVGLTLVPRGELAVALGILAALSAPARGPGSALAALVAVEVVLTATAPALVRLRRRPGWYRWAGPTPAAVRPEPTGAG